MRKTQLVQGAERPWGKAARREAASLLATTDRRVSKLRPSCRVSHAAGMSNRPGRQTHSDRLAEDEALERVPSHVSSGGSDQLQPPDGCPAGEGITTPTAERGPRTKGYSNSVDSARAACGELSQIRSGSSSLVGDHSGERIIRQIRPGLRDHAPRFLWLETLEKAKQCVHYYRTGGPAVRSCKSPREKCSQKLTTNRRTPAPATSTTHRGSGRA